MPLRPLQTTFSDDEEDKTYNILVPSTLAASPGKVIDGLAIDLSKTKWPNGKDMFNVTVITYPTNIKLMKN